MKVLEEQEIELALTEIQLAQATCEWSYWYRSASCLAFEEWEMNRDTIPRVISQLSASEIVKVELQHANCKALTFVGIVWLQPDFAINTFAYVKFSVRYNRQNRPEHITVLSFKPANKTFAFAFPSESGCQNFFEYTYVRHLQKSPELLFAINQDEWTDKLLETALLTQPNLIYQIDYQKLAYELFLEVCYLEPAAIFCVPRVDQEPQLLLHAVECEPDLLLELLESQLTPKLILTACRQKPELLCKVPKRFWHPILLDELAQLNPKVIAMLDDDVLTAPLVQTILATDCTALYMLPYRFWNHQRLLAAVAIDPFGLSVARDTDLQPSIIWLALKTAPTAIELIPPHLLTLEHILYVVQYEAWVVSAISEWTPSLVQRVLMMNPKTIAYIPREYVTNEQFQTYVSEDATLFEYVPKRAYSQVLIDRVVLQNPYLLAQIPKEFKHIKMCAKAIEIDQSLWAYVPKYLKHRLVGSQLFA